MGFTKVHLQSLLFNIWFRFSQVPVNYWKDKSNQLKALKELERKLGIKDLSDWYNMKTQDIRENGQMLFRHHNDSISQMLSSLYPDFQWDLTK